MTVPRLAKALLSAALLGPLLAVCSPRYTTPADFDHRIAHPLGAESRMAVLTLPIPSDPGAGLGAVDSARLSSFSQDFVNKGDGIIELLVAAPDAQAAAAGVFADGLMRGLVARGVPPNRIAARLATGNEVAAGNAILRYRQWAAVVPECGDWRRDVQADNQGTNSPNFGCATQRNIGLMVANPQDLVGPARQENRLGTLGDRAITLYGTARPTATPVIKPESTAGSARFE